MKIIVYAYTSPENMFEKGKKAGLSDKAANYFRHFEEVELKLYVDPENGAVTGGKLLTKF